MTSIDTSRRVRRLFSSTTVAIVFFGCITYAVPGLADGTKSLGRAGEWGAFVSAQKADKVCYAASKPKHSQDAPPHRGDVYFSVADRPTDKSDGVVSVTAGYTYKADALAEVDVDGVKFSLYTAQNTAWSQQNKALVQAMLKGKTMLVYGTPAKGRQIVDTYSLDGFAKTFAEIAHACVTK
ncbi:MAG TPA: invasion associated locus B family protein [Patescibacteria group bacterium]|nr:invasion associated locus B family protein [Patescibacteria group bacterium]